MKEYSSPGQAFHATIKGVNVYISARLFFFSSFSPHYAFSASLIALYKLLKLSQNWHLKRPRPKWLFHVLFYYY